MPRRSLYNMFEDGYPLKLEHLQPFKELYGLDVNSLVTEGEVKTVQDKAQNQSVPTWAHSDELPTWGKSEDKVGDQPTNYELFHKAAPKGTMASQLSAEHYDNPMIVLRYAITDLNNDWDNIVKHWPEEKRGPWLKDAIQIIESIAAKHRKRLELEQQASNGGEE